jgi:hypothetical protein
LRFPLYSLVVRMFRSNPKIDYFDSDTLRHDLKGKF